MEPENLEDPTELRALALGRLARKASTRRELGEWLARKGGGGAAVESVLDDLEAERLLDDALLAEHFIEVRASRMGLGRQRLMRELERRGVCSAIAEAAWQRLLEDGRVDPDQGGSPGRWSVGSNGRGGRLDAAAARRVYSALRRAGFAAAAIRDAIGPFLDFSSRNGWDDDDLE